MIDAQDVGLRLPYGSGPDTTNSAMFPDPFLDMASLVMPRSLKNVLDMCEGIWLKNGTYRMAAQRIVRYFITKVEFTKTSDQERKKLNNFLHHKLNLNTVLGNVGDDFLGYGNSMSSVVVPFRRFLRCKVCRSEQPINRAKWAFKEWKFQAYCRKCRKTVEHEHIDRRSTEEDKIAIKRWAPQHFKIRQHYYANVSEFFWNIPKYVCADVEKALPFVIEHMPWEIIQAVKQKKLFKFNPGVIYHMREDTLAGVETRGWGISRLLSNFAQAWYCQVLKRYNEALALDYVVPFRVVTPEARAKEGDPLLNMDMAGWNSKVQDMLRQHRQDPAAWHTLPFPVQYQALGGEAKNLATPELLDQGMDEMLNAIGIPPELYRGTLAWQAYPTALRMFQQTWPQLTSAYNGWLNWMLETVCTAMNWTMPDSCEMQPVTMADDIEQRQMLLQLASANMISRRTAFSPLGIDAMNEQERIMEEQRTFEEQMQQYKEDQDQRMLNKQTIAGQPPQQPGAAPAMGQPVSQAAAMGGDVTPQDMVQQAEGMAQQLLQMPYENRRREMLSVKQQNPTLHALVKAKMQDYRQQASSEGQQMVLSGQGPQQ